MINRSTGTHFGTDIVSNVESSHGVRLTGGSTGGVVEAFGDDANISLTVRGKGTGLVTVGDSSNGFAMAGSTLSITAASSLTISGPTSLNSSVFTLNSTRTFFGTSTTPISGIQRYLVEFTIAAIAATTNAISTVTVTGLTTNGALIFTQRTQWNSTANGVFITARCSTANELSLTIHNPTASTLSGSTVSAYVTQINF